MDLTCRKCKKKYFIPESKLDDKKVFFDCECGHRIVIDRRNDNWSNYVGIKKDSLSAGSILDSIFFSFNLKNTLIVSIFLFVIFLILSVTGLIGYNNFQFFIKHSFVSFLIFSSVFILAGFLYDFMLYLISRNLYNNFENNENIIFSNETETIVKDLKIVSFFSLVGTFSFSILMIPVYFLTLKNGIIYNGIVFPLLFGFAFFIVFFFYLKKNIFAYIAFHQKESIIQTFKQFFNFIKIENVNLIAYKFICSCFVNFVSIFVLGFMGSILFYILFMFSIPSSISALNGLTLDKVLSNVFLVKDGMFLWMFFISVITLFIISYLVSLHQTLISFSLKIMEFTPGRSISKNVLLSSLVVIMILFVLFFQVEFSKILMLIKPNF